VRPTLGKEPAAEEANPVAYLSGDMGIGLATFSYKLSMTSYLQTVRRLTINCLICPATSQPCEPPAVIGVSGASPRTCELGILSRSTLNFSRTQILALHCDVEHCGFMKLMQFYGKELCTWELGMADPTVSKRRAEECRQLASLEPDVDDQAFWLRMAEEWERLANLAIRPKEKASPQQNLELL
jgi:hypothetical protein